MAITLIWTTGDRLAKARKQVGISVEDMARHLGVSVATIGNLEHDRVPVKRAYVLAYHLATGVALDELDPHHDGPDDGGDVRSTASRCTAQSSWVEIATVTPMRWHQPKLEEAA